MAAICLTVAITVSRQFCLKSKSACLENSPIDGNKINGTKKHFIIWEAFERLFGRF